MKIPWTEDAIYAAWKSLPYKFTNRAEMMTAISKALTNAVMEQGDLDDSKTHIRLICEVTEEGMEARPPEDSGRI